MNGGLAAFRAICPESPRSDTQTAVTTLVETLLGPGGTLASSPIKLEMPGLRENVDAVDTS